MAEYTHLSDSDPELAPYIAELMAQSSAPTEEFDMDTDRKSFNAGVEEFNKANAHRLPKETEYRITDHELDVVDGKIRVRSLIPISEEGSTYPLMVWFHGGGWTNGNIEGDDHQLRAICVELQISVLNVEYRLAPENPHPTGLNDAYSALKWAAENAGLLCADLKKGFLVAGLSAGGNFAAVLAHRAQNDAFFKGRELTGQILQVPMVLHPHAVPEKYKPRLLSFEQNKHAPFMTAKDALSCYAYLGGSPTDPEVSPLLYPSHAGLSPAFIQVCGLDPLRDEGLLYETLLREEGVKTKIIAYPGSPHAFQYVFPDTKIAEKWKQDFREGINFLLAQ
ncbi:Alpha/Beta hydrolase protein [Mycena galericulata]|nr:Alpha/Beta hydrolase protein [Mycena galericulata]